jgi:glucosyl-3-phosphoglycerate synthase
VSTAQDWHRRSTFHHSDFPAERLVAAGGPSVSICLPARDEERTIGPIVEALMPLREAGIAEEIVVVDGSSDATAAIARDAGATVHPQAGLLPELGPVLGKGDAMWRALSVLRGEIVCFVDADSGGFGEHYARGLIGPLLCGEGVAFVKGFYERPFKVGDVTLPSGGGRVTELTARPLLNLFYPELAGIRQPLAGEFAARRELLERLPFVTGYGVETGLLIDAYRAVGIDGLAQVDLDVRQNDHQPLVDLAAMAHAVALTVAKRLAREGRLAEQPSEALLLPRGDQLVESPPALHERPPLAELRSAA